MKYTVSAQVTKEIELSFPCYFQYGDTYKMLINDREHIHVSAYEFSLGVEYRENGIPCAIADPQCKEVTADVFEAMLQDVSERVKEKLDAAFNLSQLKTA